MPEFGDARLPDRFWSKCLVENSGCWSWQRRGKHNRYGIFEFAGKSRFAHRFAYESLVGEVGAGLELDHVCRNRYCVNPAHLEPVTHYENVMRGVAPAAKQARKTHCKNGHELTGDNIQTWQRPSGRYYRRCKACRMDKFSRRRAKLTPAQVREIHDRVERGETQRSVAGLLGISFQNVSLIVRGLSWPDIYRERRG